MNDLERFLATLRFEDSDYIPIFGFPGAAGVSRSYWTTIRRRLRETGMPEHVGSTVHDGHEEEECESWEKYWGVTTPIDCEINLGRGVRGFDTDRRIEGEYEIIESESGEITRQVLDNDNHYSMPEFRSYPVRDRASWEFYRERMTPSDRITDAELQRLCAPFGDRTRPLQIGMKGAYHFLRGLMGPLAVSLTFFDDPGLLHEMSAWHVDQCKNNVFPVIETLRPEAVSLAEDVCYKGGMLLSPAQFGEFAGPLYRAVGSQVEKSGVDLLAVDSDGLVTEFADVAVSLGVNGLYPCEVKSLNDLFALRKRHRRLVLFGWLEKETINEGNEERIAAEIAGKVPSLTKGGGYFPNADHSLQPLATYDNLCHFMTILHDTCRNPEGEFPRVESTARS